MVGCGGFGAAKTGVAIMVRAAAKEPAIVALAKTFFEFMGEVSFPRNTGRCGDRRHEHSFNHRSAGESGDSRVQSNPVKDVTSGTPLDYWPRRHNTVMGIDSAKTTGFKYLDQHDLALLRTLSLTAAPPEPAETGLRQRRNCAFDRRPGRHRTAPPKLEAWLRVRPYQAVRRLQFRPPVHRPSAGRVRVPVCYRRQGGAFPLR